MQHDAGLPWNDPAAVAGFAESPPNGTLIELAARELARHGGTARALDLGCGAGRNAVPMAGLGWQVAGIDTSWPMLAAAAVRARQAACHQRLTLLRGRMDCLPFTDRTFELVIAHGIWNLATSSLEFRRALGEAARVSRPGALLFVFTFSRTTLPDHVAPVAGEPFVFTQFSGRPQIFLTAGQLLAELEAAGFTPDATVPLQELNRPRAAALRTTGPVIHQGAFRRVR